MRDYILQKSEGVHKCRSKVVQMFGKYWFKKMTEKEWNEKKGKVIVRLDDIHTEQELSDFMCKQHTIREPLDTVQFKFFLIPKFRDGMGVILFKAHHCFGDGIGCSQFFLVLSEIFDP